MGIFAFGAPWGEKIRFSGQREITVVGVGALFMRATDGKGQVRVAFMEKDNSPVSIPPISW